MASSCPTDEIFKASAEAALQKLDGGIEAFCRAVTKSSEDVSALVSASKDESSNIKEIKDLDKQLAGYKKPLECDRKKLVAEQVRSAKGIYNAKKKHMVGANAVVMEAQGPAVSDPRAQMLDEVITQVGLKTGGCMLEAKQGVAPFHDASKVANEPTAADQLLELSYMRSTRKALEARVHGEGWCQAKFMEDAKGRKMLRILKSHYDPVSFTRLALPKLEWAEKVYNFTMYAYAANFIQATIGHMCKMHARVGLVGTHYVFGIPYTAIPGADFNAKRVLLISIGKG